MGSVQTWVCVKQVKQDVAGEWNESMLLPGDIIEGFSGDYSTDGLFVSVKAKSELSSQLGKISRHTQDIWVKVRRGEDTLRLRACVVVYGCSKIQRKFTIRAASDDRHVAVLGDLTLEQCTELQERSRTVMNVEYRGYNRKGVNYDWKAKVDQYLPHHGLPIVASVLFEPLPDECSIEATSARSMAWFSAAVSSGAPLVFVNIQSEQIVAKKKAHATGREITWGRQANNTTTDRNVQGIRLWFLPGVAEMSLEMKPNRADTRFGMDIKQTEEGFICVHTVALGLAADRSGLWHLHQEAHANGKLVVISRLEGKSLMPSSTTSTGLVNCCDPNDIRETLASAIDRMESIRLHIMAWPGQTPPQADGAATLRPPDGCDLLMVE